MVLHEPEVRRSVDRRLVGVRRREVWLGVCLLLLLLYRMLPCGPDRTASQPILWIGGYNAAEMYVFAELLANRSDIRCSAEGSLIPDVVAKMELMEQDYSEHLSAARLLGPPLDYDIGLWAHFLLSRGETIDRVLCSSEGMALAHALRVQRALPGSVFIMVLRDPRSFVRQYVKDAENVTELTAFLKNWEESTRNVYRGCHLIGSSLCLVVYYEHLFHRQDEIFAALQAFFTNAGMEVQVPSRFGEATFDDESQREYPVPIEPRLLRTVAPLMSRIGYRPTTTDYDHIHSTVHVPVYVRGSFQQHPLNKSLPMIRSF